MKGSVSLAARKSPSVKILYSSLFLFSFCLITCSLLANKLSPLRLVCVCARARAHGVGVNRNGRFDSQFPIEDIGAFVITRLARMFPAHFHTRNARFQRGPLSLVNNLPSSNRLHNIYVGTVLGKNYRGPAGYNKKNSVNLFYFSCRSACVGRRGGVSSFPHLSQQDDVQKLFSLHYRNSKLQKLNTMSPSLHVVRGFSKTKQF